METARKVGAEVILELTESNLATALAKETNLIAGANFTETGGWEEPEVNLSNVLESIPITTALSSAAQMAMAAQQCVTDMIDALLAFDNETYKYTDAADRWILFHDTHTQPPYGLQWQQKSLLTN